MSRLSVLTMIMAMLAMTTPVLAAQALSLDQLLEKVKAGRVQDSAENAARIKAFKASKARQSQLLEKATSERLAGEARSKRLEVAFESNDVRIVELERALKERLGTLKELFGVLQQAAGDARGQFENSLTHVQYPERAKFLTELAQKMGQTSRLASIEEIERLWFELQREMTESGKVVRFSATVIDASGNEVEQNVVRVGTFNVIADGKYLQFVPQTGHLVELSRQPQQRYLAKLAGLARSDKGQHAFGLDPSGGQILSLLVQAPSLRERIEQGREVGYVIIALGAVALVIALERLLTLTITGFRVSAQTRRLDQPGKNPLGRILKVYHENPNTDIETLELKLTEAILRESPKINRLLTVLKIIAVVAPLLGLLGTVTGMIVTFQAITLFGTGDPKLMAGGISQALVTTVLGLCVAIPTVLLHTLVASRARRINQILEQQAAGMVAVQSEHRHGTPA
jgi:biopolymer transport protein ExbB